MFTGIVEEMGQVKGVRSTSSGMVLAIQGMKVTKNSYPGDSIAVNGVCLTATKIEKGLFYADVMRESLKRTNLGQLRSGCRVNLERAMAADGRFGGHIVSGHIDGIGTIVGIKTEGNATWYRIRASEGILKYIAEKGSVAIDGISLTIAKCDRETFSVSIIPLTARETTLGEGRIGSLVNLENDPLAKYMGRIMETDKKEIQKSKGITREFLEIHGFGRS